MNRKYRDRPNRYRPNRRGVLILAVLSLLMLFTLITITYVAVSKQAMTSSQTANRYEEVRPDHQALLNGALLQIMRDTNNRHSVLFGHSLGADMYGTWLGGTVSSTTRLNETNGQFVELQIEIDQLMFDNEWGNPLAEGIENYYRGRVLTMIDGPAAGKSTRIVYSSGDVKVRVMAFHKLDRAGTGIAIPQQGNRFIINGREFSRFSDFYYSVKPNFSNATFLADDDTIRRILMRQNETYDAVDFNNMLLGRFPEDPVQRQPGVTSERTIIPSLHRPALIRRQGANPNTMLRPLSDFHYMVKGQLDFTGKKFDPVNGPWDVDTDGDGVLDAIWVDLGYPVLRTADGRSYKPMFAIRCQDLDGRVNVNAHGCLAQLVGNYDSDPNNNFVDAGSSGGKTSVLNMPRGAGIGPAEINLSYLFADETTGVRTSPTAHDELMRRRYGSDGKPGRGTPLDDPRSMIAPFRVPEVFTPPAGVVNKSYGSPPDMQGRRYVGLDHAGWPLYSDQPFSGELTDSPYRMLLSRFGPVGSAAGDTSTGTPSIDEPYSVHELERILRRFDRDAALLPDRLLRLIDSKNGGGVRRPRQDITVASFSQPRTPSDMATELKVRAQRGHISGDINTWINNNLAPELLAGLPMDLNRPFGDGIDNDGDGIIDEPDEARLNMAWNGLFPSGASVPLDLNNDGIVDDNDANARQIFARHLYCLAMLKIARGYQHDFDGDGRSSSRETARWLAQWAVNVVDFRDQDSIMTRFAYDETPFDGWNVNDPDTETSNGNYMRTVVYGCEQPLLLLTETLAWHDHRTQRVDPMTGEAYDKDGGPVKDGEFRQMGRPRGNLVIELYHPRSRQHVAPGWLYDTSRQGLKLNQVDERTGTSAVWRLAFTTSVQTTGNLKRLVLNPKQITSVAYFTKNDNPANHPKDDLADELQGQEDVGKRFFAADAQLRNIEPNSYAVIGTAERMMLGRRVEAGVETMSTNTRDKEQTVYPVEIELDVASGKVTVGGASAPAGADRADLKNHVAVVMAPQYFDAAGTRDSGKLANGRKRRFSFLEKPQGYTIEPDLEDGKNIDFKYYDKDILKTKMPLDDGLPVIGGGDKTTQGIRNIYLQRLADPTQPWNRQFNPYIIVDVMHATANVVDLTVYNGDDPQGDDVDRFSSRQRGGESDNIWRAESTSANAGDGNITSPITHATLGYLNRSFGDPLASGPYKGDPAARGNDKPFPWLTWNNRPFVSQMELLLVPGTNARQLVEMHNTHQAERGSYNPYEPPARSSPFPHLMNYFSSHIADRNSPRLLHILEYTYVPSPFVGTQTWLSPTVFASGEGTQKFHPPFNRISTYREPGRINLNTIFSKEVFKALINHPDDRYVDALWTAFQKSRRGWETTDPNWPTEYGNPFRSMSESGSEPIFAMFSKRAADVTLLRAKLDGTGKPGNTPLFAAGQIINNKNYNSAMRNPYFRYQQLMRLGNLTTTRSNVYAIWITLGFFEVSSLDENGDTLPVDVNYKDGYRLVQELGSDTGEVRRHREFYIVDRAIPFAFERGKNHNVHDAILLSRQIE